LAAFCLCEYVGHDGSIPDCGGAVMGESERRACQRPLNGAQLGRFDSVINMSDAWSREEVEAAVADYFVMLGKELQGQPYSKAEHNRQLQNLISGRTRGSVERKHQNISAVLIELGYPYIEGYKPLGNYQALLGSVVQARLSAEAGLQEIVATTVTSEVERVPEVGDIMSIVVPAPVRDGAPARIYDRPAVRVGMPHRNFLEVEARNQSLGRAGEDMVLRFEHERLRRAGEHTLADRVEHVSRTQGDGLGYDIRSFELDGRDRLIEVKTTRFGALTPFFASRNEVEVSEERGDEFQVYRLFGFRAAPRLFTLAGPLRNSCRLEPWNYSAVPN
jgi:hypothetical protein